MENLALFDVTKKEIAHAEAGFTKLAARLKQSCKVANSRQTISRTSLAEASLLVLGGPREMFTHDEVEALKDFLGAGGSLLVCLSEGGETKLNTNINYFLEEYGISVNSDTVVRSVYSGKYFHPKECLVSSGVVNRELTRAAAGKPKQKKGNALVQSMVTKYLRDDEDILEARSDHSALSYIYPYGASLNVQKPALAILTSGPISVPTHMPVAAIFTPKTRRGRLLVVGSVKIFDDAYLDKEQNSKLFDLLVNWLLGGEVDLDLGGDDDSELGEFRVLPDVSFMAEQLKSCLQQSDDIPLNFRNMFDGELFNFDTNLVPIAVGLYETMGLKHEPIDLITPNFETPLPALQPAVFPPNLKEPVPPALELFDLDEQFASEKIRLAQLANKYSDDELVYFIRECGDVLGVTQQLEKLRFGYGDESDAKTILHKVLADIVNFKKHTQ
jgi:intraflagellar transport protein 52